MHLQSNQRYIFKMSQIWHTIDHRFSSPKVLKVHIWPVAHYQAGPIHCHQSAEIKHISKHFWNIDWELNKMCIKKCKCVMILLHVAAPLVNSQSCFSFVISRSFRAQFLKIYGIKIERKHCKCPPTPPPPLLYCWQCDVSPLGQEQKESCRRFLSLCHTP